MRFLLPVLGAVYTAFVVWLVVRIINRPDRRHRRLAALALGLPLLYVISFGPAVHVIDRGFLPRRATFRFYKSLLRNAVEDDWPMAQYAQAWRIHPTWLLVQSYPILVDDWPLPIPVEPPAPKPEATPDSD